MAVVFISHSSRDDAWASAIEAWLTGNGFADVFVDHERIAGGEKWREALRSAASTCRVVICLVTRSWLSSSECFNEFMLAWFLGRRIIPLFVLQDADDITRIERQNLERIRGEDQGIDLGPCIDSAGRLDIALSASVMARLSAGLRAAGANTRIGADPEAFEIDTQQRPVPFPGLASFGDDDADAAIFYGRSREIAETLVDIRRMRSEKDRRPFVILGTSGAGKSSLLKAGIIPRLRREAPAWLPLRAFRPGADPLLNFAEALSRTLADHGRSEAYGVIRDRLLGAWFTARRASAELDAAGHADLEAAIDAEARQLLVAAGRPDASLLISIDQAEELARADGESAAALADYLRAVIGSQDGPWRLALTVRTDGFAELQRHPRFEKLEVRGYDLRAIPAFRFDKVVEEPAKRYGVAVDAQLVDALMEDAPRDDAMPLLAFALQRLWRLYSKTGSLTERHYRAVGGLNALIGDAAERALIGLEPEQDRPLPGAEPPERVSALARSAFVPSLVQINEHGATVRRSPRWDSFSEEQQKLLAGFERWRLLVRKGKEGDGGSVEVAHEALFRVWKRLGEWLEPERARLEALRSLQIEAATWHRKGRAPGFLVHREDRLAEAEELLRHAGFAGQLGEVERDYIEACRALERSVQMRARRMWQLALGLAALLAAAGIGWLLQDTLVEQYRWRMVMGPDVRSDESLKSLPPGEQFSDCRSGCPKLVVIPQGSLREELASKTEQSDLVVRYKQIDPHLAVGIHEVTFAEWDACVAAKACQKTSDLSWGRGHRPVINVSWEDAREYVAWLSHVTGSKYRLLTEVEWEYSARAGAPVPGIFASDDDDPRDGKTRRVGQSIANAYGLFDMHGSVREWIEDCEPSSDVSVSTASVRTQGECVRRLARHGNDRAAYTAGYRNDDLGFRVVRSPRR